MTPVETRLAPVTGHYFPMKIKQTEKLGDGRRHVTGWRWWIFDWERSETTGGGLLAPAYDWSLSMWIRGWKASVGLTHYTPPANKTY